MRGRLVKRGTKRTIEPSHPKPPPNPLLNPGLKLKIRLNGDTMATFHANEKGVASVAKLETEDSEVVVVCLFTRQLIAVLSLANSGY